MGMFRRSFIMAKFVSTRVKAIGLLLAAAGGVLIFFNLNFVAQNSTSKTLDMDITSERDTNPEVHVLATTKAKWQKHPRIPDISGGDNKNKIVKSQTSLQKSQFDKLNPNLPILTAESDSRLGNQMFMYVTLLAISQWNNRTAYMPPKMVQYLSKYFEPSLPALTAKAYQTINWEVIQIGPKFPENIYTLPEKSASGASSRIKLCCWVQSWRYFHHLRPQILQEFKFLPEINDRTQSIISKAKVALYPEIPPTEVTLIGIHVRRGDYVDDEKRGKVVLPQMDFYQNAMAYMKSKVKNPLYIVASDGIEWCKNNFPNTTTGFPVHFLEGTSEDDGGLDMAVLSATEHVIFGVGTFGFWAGYFVNGEVVYCSDCIPENSIWLQHPMIYAGDYIGNFIVPTWTGMSRNGRIQNNTRNQ